MDFWWILGGFSGGFFEVLGGFPGGFSVGFFGGFFFRSKYICFNMYLDPEKIHQKIHQEIHRVFPCAFFGVLEPKISCSWGIPWANIGATAFAPIRSLPSWLAVPIRVGPS